MSASLYTNFAASITTQDAHINTLEEQISTGYAVQTPDQNPAAFEVATIANDQVSESPMTMRRRIRSPRSSTA